MKKFLLVSLAVAGMLTTNVSLMAKSKKNTEKTHTAATHSTVLTPLVNFSNPEKDYSMDNDPTAKYSRIELKGAYMDVFKGTDQSAPYVISVLKTTAIVNVKYDELFSDEFKKGYVKNCDCQVTSVKPADYQYEKGVVYMIKSKVGNQVMRGYSITFVKGKSMYNIEYYTKDELFDQSAAEFNRTISSFRISQANRLVADNN